VTWSLRKLKFGPFLTHSRWCELMDLYPLVHYVTIRVLMVVNIKQHAYVASSMDKGEEQVAEKIAL